MKIIITAALIAPFAAAWFIGSIPWKLFFVPPLRVLFAVLVADYSAEV
ncbi:MAG: hypothetical protein WA997_06750 [Anaerolineales bacterium]